MKREIVRVEGLKKAIHGSQVLNGLNLSVYEGEILGMTGLSGSGKSVAAQILAGSRSFEEGEIYIAGRKSEAGGKAGRPGNGIYHIRAVPDLFPCLTVEENVCLTEAGAVAGIFPTRMQLRKVREAAHALDICLDSRASVNSLSLYEKHQVSLLRAYYLHAKLIIMDNITNDYTEEEFCRLGRLLLRLKQKGVSILLVESMTERVTSFTDRLVVLRNGRDEGILFREEYGQYDINKMMSGDYNLPEAVGRVAAGREQEILLEACRICGQGLQGLTFHLNKGEVVGFTDEEDALCTSVQKLFLGDARTESGTVVLDGEPVNIRMKRAGLIELGFGYVDFYKSSVFPQLSLKDNLTITSLNRLTSRAMIHARLEKRVAEDLLEALNFPSENLKRPLCEVSNREQLVAALYKWILNRSKVVVLNNVLSGTDMIMRNIVKQFLNELQRRKAGALLFSPNVRELYELCDRVYKVRAGRIEEEVAAAEWGRQQASEFELFRDIEL